MHRLHCHLHCHHLHTTTSTPQLSPSSLPPPSHLPPSLLRRDAGAALRQEDDDRDALTRQIRHGFEFVGIHDIDVVWAEGQNPLFFENSEENKAVALEAATEVAEEIAELEI